MPASQIRREILETQNHSVNPNDGQALLPQLVRSSDYRQDYGRTADHGGQQHLQDPNRVTRADRKLSVGRNASYACARTRHLGK